MNGQDYSESADGWWEITIVLFVMVSVFGAALLALQDRPSLSEGVPDHSTIHLTRVPQPATPTPTRGATSSPDPNGPSPSLVSGTLSPLADSLPHQLATPTPTIAAPSPSVGWGN